NKIIKNNEYDVIHVHGNSTTMALELLIAKINKVPIRIAHGHSTNTKYPYLHSFLRRLFDSSYTHGIAVSKKAGDWLYNGRPYNILENGIEVEKYEFNQYKRKKLRDSI